jgi:hypothetical protein
MLSLGGVNYIMAEIEVVRLGSDLFRVLGRDIILKDGGLTAIGYQKITNQTTDKKEIEVFPLSQHHIDFCNSVGIFVASIDKPMFVDCKQYKPPIPDNPKMSSLPSVTLHF